MMKKKTLRKVRKRSKELSGILLTVFHNVLLASLFLRSTEAAAVLFIATDHPAHNTTPPPDESEARAWNLQGIWRTCQGTPIAPHWFLSAKHIGGAIGDTFTVHGQSHQTIARVLDPESDLVLWGVTGSFQDYAELYTGGIEIGKRMLVFGRGEARGSPVVLESNGLEVLKGWRRGQGQGVMRWGENMVTHIADEPLLTERNLGELIGAEFNRNGLPNEAGLSPCDSGGGMFLLQDGEWKLAAINYAAGGQYNLSQEGDGFPAMLFDEGGFFRYTEIDDTNEFIWEFVEDEPEDHPGIIWGTRIQHRLDWIQQTIAELPSPQESIRLKSASSPHGPFESVLEWSIVQNPLALKIPAPAGTRFYCIESTDEVYLRTPLLSGTDLLLPFSGRPILSIPNN